MRAGHSNTKGRGHVEIGSNTEEGDFPHIEQEKSHRKKKETRHTHTHPAAIEKERDGPNRVGGEGASCFARACKFGC